MRNLFIVLLFLSSNLFAADRYWVGGGSNTNWNAAGNTNWSATSGGANNASVPTTGDVVIFDANGNSNCTINVNVSLLSFTVTSGYTSTITHNAQITISTGGSIELGANYTIAGASPLVISGTVTLTSNGKTWPNGMTFQTASTTKTLADNWTVNGIVSFNSNGIQTINGSTLTCAGGFTCTNTAENVSGTTHIVVTGGLWNGSGTLQNDLTIAGSVTYNSISFKYRTGTITLSSGSLSMFSSSATLFINGDCTLNTNGVVWSNLTFSAGAYTVTLNALLSVSNNLTYAQTSAITLAGSFGFTTSNLIMLHTGGNIQTFANGVTYTVTTFMDIRTSFYTSTGTSLVQLTSDHATNKAIITLSQGAACSVVGKFTRIDASAGRSINVFNGNITECLNVNAYTDLKTTSHNFIN